jgi:hypothetical protein
VCGGGAPVGVDQHPTHPLPWSRIVVITAQNVRKRRGIGRMNGRSVDWGVNMTSGGLSRVRGKEERKRRRHVAQLS